MIRRSRAHFPSKEWERDYGREYWSPFIFEGMSVAAEIRKVASLPGRKVKDI